jgi:hypothetical protein
VASQLTLKYFLAATKFAPNLPANIFFWKLNP